MPVMGSQYKMDRQSLITAKKKRGRLGYCKEKRDPYIDQTNVRM